MRRSLLIRTAAVATAAAAASLAIAGLAGASSPPAPKPTTPKPTTLAIDEAKKVIKLGQKDIITGRLMAGKRGIGDQTVVLDTVNGTTLTEVKAKVTNSGGNVLFMVRPKVTTQYELVFAGTSKLAASDSKVITVTVRVKARH
jgi:hypothetical protein